MADKKDSSNKDLITLPEGGEIAVPDDDVFKAATKSGDYLPRLQLLTSNSEIVKDGKFPMNHFAIVRDQNNQDIGESVDVLVVAWRAKAIENTRRCPLEAFLRITAENSSD